MAESRDHTMQAYADDEQRLHCMKCQRVLHTKDVAMFIRSDPKDAFNSWCPGCTYEIMRLAVAGLDGEGEVVGVLF